MNSTTFHNVFLTFSVFLLFICTSCESSKNTSQSESSSNLSEISLSKSGMSGYTNCQISKDQIIVSSKGRSGEEEKALPISEANWKELNQLVSKLNLSQFDKWESPTQARFYDGARATTISININGQTYTSQAFDEGKPPAELKKVYEYLETVIGS